VAATIGTVTILIRATMRDVTIMAGDAGTTTGLPAGIQP
jgi:hypothetical protein